LLAGLYELPNCPGKLTAEEALRHLKEIGLRPLRIRPLTEAKHVFSHVEWHMCGYVVLVEEPDEVQGNLLFVEVQDAKEHYAVPIAFAAYWGAIVDET
jgi:A/G-specific adenine glycosylase